MDEYFDQYLSSSSWSDVNAKENSSWAYCSESDLRNGLLPSSLGVYEDDEKNSPGSILSANHTMESLAAQDTSSAVLGGESDYCFDKSLLSGEAQNKKYGQNFGGHLSSKLGNAGLRYDAAIPILSSVNHSSSKQIPIVGDMTSSLSYLESGHFGGHDSELSEIQRSLRNLQTLSPFPELWLPPSYEEVPSLSPVTGQDGTQGFGLQEANLNNVIDITANKYVGIDKILQFGNLSASITTEGKQDLQNHPLSSFAARPQMTAVGLPSLKQTTLTAPTSDCNGNGKPRVRACRGQATDPHSIAERLRREKIAERMKSLQELVPNSIKTDKASMLDEIIDYVKFLQLQIKGSNGLSPSAQAGQGVDISLNPDQVAFEEEVVKLMESNVSMAMQQLQSKGLCLMPIALASAVSNEKAAISPGFAPERKKFGSSNSGTSNSSLPSNDGIHQMTSESNNGIHQMSSESNNIIGKPIREGMVANAYGCNGAVKPENTTTFCPARELKPKT